MARTASSTPVRAQVRETKTVIIELSIEPVIADAESEVVLVVNGRNVNRELRSMG